MTPEESLITDGGPASGEHAVRRPLLRILRDIPAVSIALWIVLVGALSAGAWILLPYLHPEDLDGPAP